MVQAEAGTALRSSPARELQFRGDPFLLGRILGTLEGRMLDRLGQWNLFGSAVPDGFSAIRGKRRCLTKFNSPITLDTALRAG